MRKDLQKGEGRAGFLITIVLFAAAVFAAFKILPVRINAYQFRDTLREEAVHASVHNDDRKALARILEEAESLKIPLRPDDLKIRRTEREVIITARFEQPIDLKVATYTYKFNAEQRAPIF